MDYKIPEKTAIIGKIPGYNRNIDKDHLFEHELLKGITFIDLRPMSYTFSDALKHADITELFKDLETVVNQIGLFKSDPETSKELFKDILKRMDMDFFSSGDKTTSFSDIEMIRIIGANDSTFTETFSNNFDESNTMVDKLAGVSKKLGSTIFGQTIKGAKGFSYSDTINTLKNINSTITSSAGQNGYNANLLQDIATGSFYGMNMAMPNQWMASSYTSTLTLFVKLIAPVGTPECIQENILKPILYLMAAASPITFGGTMYGFPLMWDIQAHGISNFRLGGIAAMSFIRGSFETTFNSLLQPTIIDVRLTLVPVLNDFAAQAYIEGGKSIYTNPQELGTQHPGDIRRGLLNEELSNVVKNNKPQTTQEKIISIKL